MIVINIGPNPVAAAAGITASQRAVDRPGLRRDPGRKVTGRADDDELITSPESMDSAEGLRSLSGNEQEDAREDHQKSPTYSRSGPGKPATPRLDINV